MAEGFEEAHARELAQIRALDRAAAVAEFGPDGVLQQANDNYLSLLGCAREEAIGRDYRSFCLPAFAQSPEFQSFWQGLVERDPHVDVVERVRHDGSRRWLEAYYTPVRDAQGRLVQILKIATDVTARVLSDRAQQEKLRRLSLVADATDAAVLITDTHAGLVYVNAGFTRMFGWTPEEVQGRQPVPLLSPQQDEAAVADFYAALHAGQAAVREEIVAGKQGQRYWAKVVSNPVLGADGAVHMVVSVLTDITRAKMHEALQHRALEAMARDQPLAEVLELVCHEVERISPDIVASILGVDDNGRLHPLAAPSLPASYSQQLEGLPIGPAVGSCGTAAWRNAVVLVDDIQTDPLWAGYRDLVRPLGLVGCWSTPMRNSQGRVLGTFAFYFRRPRNQAVAAFHQRLVDACTQLCTLALEREQTHRRIRQLAFYDSLTGLPNRSLLQATMDQAIAQAARSEEPLAVLFVNLDRFKQVNDSLGHPAGDALLCQVAERLQRGLRPADVAGRLSGDEFAVVLPRCDAEQAANLVERLQALLAEPATLAGAAMACSATIGVAMFPADGRDTETLLHRADMAMDQARRGGRGRFRFFSADMNRLAQERLALERALRQALQDGQLRLHYQPQVDLASGSLYGVEALARWTHPELGEISPVRFIPLAEECGLIADLGRWALGEACRQLAAWRAQGIAVPAVSVNLSPTSFHDLELPRGVAATLAAHGLAPRDLMLELTESVLLDTHPGTQQTIREVHALGVRLSMDDFGTGYSSLSYLRRLPITELKLDRSFVADLETDAAARALSSAIMGIGRSLDLTVVAEGVETAGQCRLLQEQGYPVAQGYFFARPLVAGDLADWLLQAGVPSTASR